MVARFVAVLDNIRSMHNVGAIFRTADGAGVEKLLLCGMTATPPRPEIRKAALGAEEHVAWEYFKQTEQALEKLAAENYFIVALDNTRDSIDFRAASYRFPLALVIGHEFHGISQSVLEKCHAQIALPMHGKKGSLNVAVAFGIAAYEISHRLKGGSGEVC